MCRRYARIHATGTRLKLEAVSDLTGDVFDEVELVKPAGWGTAWHTARGGPFNGTVRLVTDLHLAGCVYTSPLHTRPHGLLSHRGAVQAARPRPWWEQDTQRPAPQA